VIGRKITLLHASGDDNGKIAGLSKARVEDNVVVRILDVAVADGVRETGLVADDEQSGVVLVDPLGLMCSG
jgi:hypothetical protein